MQKKDAKPYHSSYPTHWYTNVIAMRHFNRQRIHLSIQTNNCSHLHSTLTDSSCNNPKEWIPGIVILFLSPCIDVVDVSPRAKEMDRDSHTCCCRVSGKQAHRPEGWGGRRGQPWEPWSVDGLHGNPPGEMRGDRPRVGGGGAGE